MPGHNPYLPPAAAVSDAAESDERPVRGAWLSTLLVIMILANLSAVAMYSLVVAGKLVLPGRASWVALTLLTLVVGNVVFLVATWNWRKWGMYGAVATAIIAFVLNLVLGVSYWKALFGFAGLALLVGSVNSRWKYFR